MNIINADNKTPITFREMFGSRNFQDKVKYDEKNVNEKILYKGLNAQYFNSQKYAIKRQKTGCSNISFKAIGYYYPVQYKSFDEVYNDKEKFTTLFLSILKNYFQFFESKGLKIDNNDTCIDSLCSHSFEELEKSRKKFENIFLNNDKFKHLLEQKKTLLNNKKIE